MGTFSDRLQKYHFELQNLKEELTFAQYLDKVKKNPQLTQLSHERIYNMVISHGMSENGKYNFFEHELFGLDEPIDDVVNYFKSAGQRLDIRKRILLLHGPVSGGKSTFADLLKSGLEAYTRTEQGVIYRIKNCPISEEPLHLIPKELRSEFMNESEIYIEGDLCPYCAHHLENTWKNIEEVPVERFHFSEQQRIGIGTFLPSDPKSQDIAELIGHINYAKIAELGSQTHPEVFEQDGELNISNRGIMEFIEMLKSDKRFLYILLTLSQEQVIKIPGFARVYVDEVVISHTNEQEFIDFQADKKSEALQDRIFKIDFPYTLAIDQEERIYRKLLREAKFDTHIAPLTLIVASMFAVLSRLENAERTDLDYIKKMRLYNLESVEGFSIEDISELREQTPREGMHGVSPRYIANQISTTIVKGDISCITPYKLLRALKDGLSNHPRFDKKEIDRLSTDIIGLVSDEYDRLAQKAVQKAVIYSFEESANNLMENYLNQIEAYLENTEIKDPISGKMRRPDEKLMIRIENKIGVTESIKDDFRSEILRKAGSIARKGGQFNYSSHPKLQEAIEATVYEDHKDTIKLTTTTKTPSPELLKRINAVVDRLIVEYEYCEVCANDLLNYVGSIFNR